MFANSQITTLRKLLGLIQGLANTEITLFQFKYFMVPYSLLCDLQPLAWVPPPALSGQHVLVICRQLMLISAGMTSLDLSCYCVQGEKPLSISCSMLANQGLQDLQQHLSLWRE